MTGPGHRRPTSGGRRIGAGPRLGLVVVCALVALTAVGARGQPTGAPKPPPAPAPQPPPRPAPVPPPTVDVAAGQQAFLTVARVLQSPRCQNCHPVGDRPLQGDTGRPHRFLISRRSADAGLECSACHQERNSEALGIAGGPPGAPHWGLPPAATPMVFQGKTPRALCEQLKDPAATGGRDLTALLHHVSEDPLVLWGWKPGGKRTTPPVSHDVFVAAFRTWVASGGACP